MADDGYYGGSFGEAAGQFPPHTAAVPPWAGPRVRSRLRRPADARPGEPVPDVWEQEGYRWRADDGSEAAATGLAPQDADASVAIATAVRLRVVANVTGDPGAKRFCLEFRKVGETDYVKVAAL